MDVSRIEGSSKQFKGAIKRAIGSLLGNERLKAQGAADQIEGKALNILNSVYNTITD